MSDQDAVNYYASVIDEVLPKSDPGRRSSKEVDEDERVLSEAARELKERGPAAACAIPALIRSLKFRIPRLSGTSAWVNVPTAAREALVKIGKKAVPALRQALDDKDSMTRVHAARALWALEGNADEVLPVLLAVWRGDEESGQAMDVRVEAGHALAQIGPKKKDAILPVLSDALVGKDDSLAWAAAYVLFEMAPEVPEALPPLLAAIKGPRGRLIKRCSSHLTNMPAKAVPVLARALDDEDARVRAWAAAALGETHQAEAVTWLATATADDEPSVRQAAVYGLYELYGDAAPAAPARRKLLDDPDAAVRHMAKETLGRLGALPP
jgi:HEAT repeat protein